MTADAPAFSPLLDNMCRVARECGRMMREADVAHAAAKIKTSRRDLVTEYDVRIQAYAVEALTEAFPDAHFICEEGSAAAPAGDGGAFSRLLDIKRLKVVHFFRIGGFVHDFFHALRKKNG